MKSSRRTIHCSLCLAEFGAVREEPGSWMKEYADKAVEGLLPFDNGIWVKTDSISPT